MQLIDALSRDQALLIGFAAILGSVFGSFINVVIHRLPRMMQLAWQADCREMLELSAEQATETSENLLRPSSRCPHCGHVIRWWANIPILSFLLLRGRCSACQSPISLQYPAVEILSGVSLIMVALSFGVSWQALAAAAFSLSLIALSGIDFRTKLLPDSITLPLLWSGLLVNAWGLFTDLHSAVLGAAAGYLSLWLVFQIFKRLTGKEGMGYGDFKLLAALGAWCGWQALPLIILAASVTGAIVGIALIVLKRIGRDIPIPFGPYLAVAGWLALLYGPTINRWYLGVLLGPGI